MLKHLLDLMQDLPMLVKFFILVFCVIGFKLDSLLLDFCNKIITYEVTVHITFSIKKK